MKKTLYLEIKSRLKTIRDTDGSTKFKHFDLWNQNVQFIEEDSPFEFPAVFVEFLPFPWTTLGNRCQQAEITIRLHIVTRWLAQTADYSPVESEMLDYLDLPELVYNALQSFNTTDTNGLMCINSITNHNHDTILDSIEEYKCLVHRQPLQTLTIVSATTPIITTDTPS